MWPPMPGSFLFCRCTMAMAFQRIRLLMRRSRCAIAGIRNFLLDRNGVDVGRIQLNRDTSRRSRERGYQGSQQVAAVSAVLRRSNTSSKASSHSATSSARSWQSMSGFTGNSITGCNDLCNATFTSRIAKYFGAKSPGGPGCALTRKLSIY